LLTHPGKLDPATLARFVFKLELHAGFGTGGGGEARERRVDRLLNRAR
jgi:hypothetical protein